MAAVLCIASDQGTASCSTLFRVFGLLCVLVAAMADDDDDDPNRLWCVCRRPAGEDRFMICCDC